MPSNPFLPPPLGLGITFGNPTHQQNISGPESSTMPPVSAAGSSSASVGSASSANSTSPAKTHQPTVRLMQGLWGAGKERGLLHKKKSTEAQVKQLRSSPHPNPEAITNAEESLHAIFQELVSLNPQKYAQESLETALRRCADDIRPDLDDDTLIVRLNEISKCIADITREDSRRLKGMSDKEITSLVAYMTDRGSTPPSYEEFMQLELARLTAELDDFDGPPERLVALSKRIHEINAYLEESAEPVAEPSQSHAQPPEDKAHPPERRGVKHVHTHTRTLSKTWWRTSAPEELAVNTRDLNNLQPQRVAEGHKRVNSDDDTIRYDGVPIAPSESQQATPFSDLLSPYSAISSLHSVGQIRPKMDAITNAGISTSFEALELEPPLGDKRSGKKILLGTGGSASVFSVRLHHEFEDAAGKTLYGKEFAFKQLIDKNNLPHRIVQKERKLLQTTDKTEKQAHDSALQEAKNSIIKEFRINAMVNDIPQVMKVYALCEVDDTYGILAEKINGKNMVEFVHTSPIAVSLGVITAEEKVSFLLKATADALVAANAFSERGIVHGDFQPANLMYSEEERIFKVIDFGGGSMFGEPRGVFTPGFGILGTQERDEKMARPGQDVFGIGKTLHYGLTGTAWVEKPYVSGEDIPFTDDLEELSADRKNDLMKLLNSMIFPEDEGSRDARKVLELPILKKLEHNDKIHCVYEKIKGMSKPKPTAKS